MHKHSSWVYGGCRPYLLGHAWERDACLSHSSIVPVVAEDLYSHRVQVPGCPLLALGKLESECLRGGHTTDPSLISALLPTAYTCYTAIYLISLVWFCFVSPKTSILIFWLLFNSINICIPLYRNQFGANAYSTTLGIPLPIFLQACSSLSGCCYLGIYANGGPWEQPASADNTWDFNHWNRLWRSKVAMRQLHFGTFHAIVIRTQINYTSAETEKK